MEAIRWSMDGVESDLCAEEGKGQAMTDLVSLLTARILAPHASHQQRLVVRLFARFCVDVACTVYDEPTVEHCERVLREALDVIKPETPPAVPARSECAKATAEVERVRVENAALLKTQDRLVARIAATDAPSDIEETLRCLEAARTKVATLEAKIEELRATQPNWSHAEALEQRAALIRQSVDQQAEIRRLRAELAQRDGELHARARHPDYDYFVTCVPPGTVHEQRDDSEPNPHDGQNGRTPRGSYDELHWMRRKS
jgi:hypothetical protein